MIGLRILSDSELAIVTLMREQTDCGRGRDLKLVTIV